MSQSITLPDLLESVRQIDFSLPEHEPLLFQTINYLGQFRILTRQKRLELQQAFLELTSLYIKNYLDYPNESAVLEIRESIKRGYQYLFAPGSMGVRCHEFLQNVSYQIYQQNHEEAVKTLADSFNEIAKWDYTSNEVNDSLLKTLIFQLQSLLILLQFTENYPEDHQGKNAVERLLANRFIEYQESGLESTTWQETLEELNSLKPTFSDQENALYLNILIALVLYFDPEYSPMLEKLNEEHSNAINTYLASIQSENLKNPQPTQDLSLDEIVQHYKERLEIDGFSEHALYEAFGLIKQKLENEMNFGEYVNFVQELIDFSRDYTTEEVIETLDEVIFGLLEMRNFMENPPESLTAQDLENEMEASISEMNQRLSGGISVSPVLSRVFIKFSLMAMKIDLLSEDQMHIVPILLKRLFAVTMSTVENHIPEDMRASYPQMQQFFSQITTFLDQIEGPDWQKDIAMQNFEDGSHRFIGSINLLPIAPEFENNPMIKQFIDLFPQLSTRMMALNENLEGEDKKEFDRIHSARENTMNLLKSAYTLKQLIQHQQFGLRQIGYDIGQFERRKLIYFSPCSLPSHDAILHVNQVFFSGTKATKRILEISCIESGLHLATQKSNTTSLEDRWFRMLESGLTIFDFSEFNPKMADPKNWKQEEKELERIALEAASLTAVAAFECGWALALGKPMVIILKQGQAPPFDIDIQPCYLLGNQEDKARLIEALQIAMYGKPRLSKENLLAKSSAYLRQFVAPLPSEKTKDLLEALETNRNDATLLKLAANHFYDLLPTQNQIILFPPFAGEYPDLKGKKQLFHITAFRTWSKATEAILKSVCKELEIEYNVGYDSLDSDIMAAIWKDITAAHFIIADITLLNPNATLELAIALTLGKPTLIFHQHEFIQNYFPPLMKIRTHSYDLENGLEDFQKTLKSFLQAKSN